MCQLLGMNANTPHVLLVGDGARQFAVAEGFTPRSLRTPEAENAWREWLKTSRYQPEINAERRDIPGNRENHDTIGMLALGADGRMALRPRDFKSLAYTSFAIRARAKHA